MKLQKNMPVLYELETVQGQQALVGKRLMKETKKERKRTLKNQRSFPFAFRGPTFFDLKVLLY
jgi:hypothetical protein